FQPMRQRIDQGERARDGGQRLERVDVGKSRESRQLLVEPGIVLHCARAQRIEPSVDRVVLLRQPGEVAYHLRLAETRQANLCPPIETAEARFKGRRIPKIDTAMPGRALFEDQPLFDLQATVAGDRLERRCQIRGGAGAEGSAPIGQHSTSRSSRSSRSMSSSVTISVAATKRTSA